MAKTPDPAAIDRKSRPIYDLLNRGEYKAALKQCNQALNKYSKHGLFTILKAFALDRLGDATEALALARDVVESSAGDEEVLNHTASLLRSHGEYELLLQMYQKSAAANPRNVGLLQEVFLAHVRLGQVLEQQQVAMKISKVVPGEMQSFWVICSMMAQAARARAGCAVSSMQPEMLLKLAAALADKQIQAEGGLSYEALLVYLDVLQAQGAPDRCAELLNGPSAAAVHMPHELSRLRAQTALAARNRDEARDLLKDALLTAVPDDWAGYALLFSCRLPQTAWPCEHAANGIIGVQGGLGNLSTLLRDRAFWGSLEAPQSNEAIRAEVADLHAFLGSVIEQVELGVFEAARGGLIRGPYLARVDLAWRQVQVGVEPASLLSSAMLEYFNRFKTKAVAHLDLRHYAQALPPELRTWLAAALADERKSIQNAIQSNHDWTQRSMRVTLNSLIMERHMGLPAFTSASAAVEYAHACMHLYGQWRPVLASCDKRELGVGEEALELASEALITAFFISKERVYIAQAVALLAVAAKHHPFSPGLLLSLAGLQMLLGNSESVLDTFNQVGPRNVQLDSLCHHVMPALAELPLAKHQSFLRMVLGVRSSHEGAVAEALAESYARGTYSKVLEFSQFQRRGRESMTYLEADSQMALQTLRGAIKKAIASAAAGKVAMAAQRLGAEAWALLENMQMDGSMAGQDASELWVNDDLSQRPVWLAPHTCESVLAALEWWETAYISPGSQRAAAGVRWWQLPKAATSDRQEAQAWRTKRSSSLSFVSFQPVLMAQVLRGGSSGGARGGRVLEPSFDAAAAMQQVLQAAGTSWLEVCEWHSTQDWSVERMFLEGKLSRTAGGRAKGNSLQQLMRTLALASLALGSALHSLMPCAPGVANAEKPSTAADSSGNSGAKGSQGEHCARVMADVLVCVSMRVVYGLQGRTSRGVAGEGEEGAGRGLLDGAPVHALVVVVQHVLLFLLGLALSAGAGLSSGHAGGDGKRAQECRAGIAVVQKLVSAVETVCTALQTAVEQCVCALGEGIDISARHRRYLAEAADDAAVDAELKKLAAAQKALLADVLASLKPMPTACKCIAALFDAS